MPRKGDVRDPSGWVADCPFGECREGTRCNSVVLSVTEEEATMTEQIDPENVTFTESLVEESLVEEVSIDGMCGVY